MFHLVQLVLLERETSIKKGMVCKTCDLTEWIAQSLAWAQV